MYAPAAVFLLFTPTRAAAVLEQHFAWLRDKPVTCDGYSGYPSLTGTIQWDFVHVLRKAEKLAVDGVDAGDEARYDMLKCLYHDAKQVRTPAPRAIADLTRRAHALAASYKDHEMRTYLANAIPDLFTFLEHPGMSPHSNDVARQDQADAAPLIPAIA